MHVRRDRLICFGFLKCLFYHIGDLIVKNLIFGFKDFLGEGGDDGCYVGVELLGLF